MNPHHHERQSLAPIENKTKPRILFTTNSPWKERRRRKKERFDLIPHPQKKPKFEGRRWNWRRSWSWWRKRRRRESTCSTRWWRERCGEAEQAGDTEAVRGEALPFGRVVEREGPAFELRGLGREAVALLLLLLEQLPELRRDQRLVPLRQGQEARRRQLLTRATSFTFRPHPRPSSSIPCPCRRSTIFPRPLPSGWGSSGSICLDCGGTRGPRRRLCYFFYVCPVWSVLLVFFGATNQWPSDGDPGEAISGQDWAVRMVIRWNPLGARQNVWDKKQRFL